MSENPHPISALGEEIINGLAPIFCMFGHKWEEYTKEKFIGWGDGRGEAFFKTVRYRQCTCCKQKQIYKAWRWWFFLDPWVDIKCN